MNVNAKDAPDFRAEDPVWVRYLEYTGSNPDNLGGTSDKYYEARIDFHTDGLYYLTKRYGARPDSGAGSTKVESYQNLPGAQFAATEILNAKKAKGYREVERPWGAGMKVRRETGADFYAEGNEAF